MLLSTLSETMRAGDTKTAEEVSNFVSSKIMRIVIKSMIQNYFRWIAFKTFSACFL